MAAGILLPGKNVDMPKLANSLFAVPPGKLPGSTAAFIPLAAVEMMQGHKAPSRTKNTTHPSSALLLTIFGGE